MSFIGLGAMQDQVPYDQGTLPTLCFASPKLHLWWISPREKACVLYSMKVRMTLGLQSVNLSILLTEEAFIFCYHLDSKCAFLQELNFDLCSFCLRTNIRQTCTTCTRDPLSAPQICQES